MRCNKAIASGFTFLIVQLHYCQTLIVCYGSLHFTTLPFLASYSKLTFSIAYLFLSSYSHSYIASNVAHTTNCRPLDLFCPNVTFKRLVPLEMYALQNPSFHEISLREFSGRLSPLNILDLPQISVPSSFCCILHDELIGNLATREWQFLNGLIEEKNYFKEFYLPSRYKK